MHSIRMQASSDIFSYILSFIVSAFSSYFITIARERCSGSSIHIRVCVCMYICIYIERERERLYRRQNILTIVIRLEPGQHTPKADSND